MEKKIFSFFGLLFFLIPFSLFSQSGKSIDTDDLLMRASYASFYIEETQESFFSGYRTPYGEACAHIILKKFRDLLPLPETKSLTVDFMDKQKIEKLVEKLNQLRENPPTWEEIFLLEEQRLIQWDKAIRQKSKYHPK